jgi:hypothetical protein
MNEDAHTSILFQILGYIRHGEHEVLRDERPDLVLELLDRDLLENTFLPGNYRVSQQGEFCSGHEINALSANCATISPREIFSPYAATVDPFGKTGASSTWRTNSP